jgi:hypothetical protein
VTQLGVSSKAAMCPLARKVCQSQDLTAADNLGLLHLSVEAIVLQPRFQPLFTTDARHCTATP